jgi:hypothetical protein
MSFPSEQFVAITPLILIASRESSGWALAFLTIFGGPILLLLMFELAFGRAVDRTRFVRRQESPREYWLLLLFHLLILLFVVGFILFYLFYYSS